MQGFQFKNETALVTALQAGVVPQAVKGRPATLFKEKGGSLWVSPKTAPTSETINKLAETAVSFVSVPSTGVHRTQRETWEELVPLVPTSDLNPDNSEIIFKTRQSNFLKISSQLSRLGSSFIQYAFHGKALFIRVQDPPYYMLTSAFDRVEGLRAFRILDPPDTSVWVEVGHNHPLKGSLRTEAKHTVFIQTDSWHRVNELKWTPLFKGVPSVVPGPKVSKSKDLDLKLEVTMRLRPQSTSKWADAWVVRVNPMTQLAQIANSLPQKVVQQLKFAVLGTSSPVLIIAAHVVPGSDARPYIDVQGEAYYVNEQLHNLWIPTKSTVEPALRRDRLRDLLAPDPKKVYLTVPCGPRGAFKVQYFFREELKPLESIIAYDVLPAVHTVDAWPHSDVFKLDKISEIRPKVQPPKQPKKPLQASQMSQPSNVQTHSKRAYAINSSVSVKPSASRSAAGPETPKDLQREAIEKEISAIEQEFLALTCESDDPIRTEMWLKLAELYTQIGFRTEAGLCWTRALWEQEGDEAHKLAVKWRQAEVTNSRIDGYAALKLSAPGRDDTRLVASCASAGSLGELTITPDILQELQNWLNVHSENLDLRSLWLATVALSRLSGGDPLRLAKGRDYILEKLHKGLSPDRELPAFLRSPDGEERSARTDELAQTLTALLERAQSTKRQKASIEATPEISFAYVKYMTAVVLARIGKSAQARTLEKEATAVLHGSDPIHNYLSRAFQDRIKLCTMGASSDAPLSSETTAELNKLDRFCRYKVDRLRQASQLLEPHERLNPMSAFQSEGPNSAGNKFEHFRGIQDKEALANAVITEWKKASTPDISENEKVHILKSLFDFFPLLSESQIFPMLSRVVNLAQNINAIDRAAILGKALILAGHFGYGKLAESLTEVLQPLLVELASEDPDPVTEVLSRILRTLRKVGLRTEAKSLLDALIEHTKEDDPDTLIFRLQLGAGYAFLGHPEAVYSHQEAAFERLKSEDISMNSRLELCRTLAQSLALVPKSASMEGLTRLETEQLPIMTDSFNTNTHFCVSLVHFMESLILGYGGDGSVLDEKVRYWVDEEEYLIRKRIHRDIRKSS